MTSTSQPNGERRYTRRDVLVGVGAAGVATVASTDTAEAAGTDPPADSPADYVDHITEVRDDLDELRDYAPMLVTTKDVRDRTTGQFGWIAESEEYDVKACYYWIRSPTQKSILSYIGLDINTISIPFTDISFGADSHATDHEPIIVFVNPDGTVDSVVFSGGHHYAAELDGQFGHLAEDRVSGRRTHANLRVIPPWNHFVEAGESENAVFVESYAEFGSWLDKRDVWYRNGRYESTAVEAIEDPFRFYDSGDGDYLNYWWEPGTWDAWMAKNFYNRRVNTADLRHE